MADVFISYCSADRARVGEIAHGLEKEGLSVWWDRSLLAGSSYETEIDQALSEAKAVIVVWSPASVVSDWVRSEADAARVEGKLVPVTIEACRVPRPFDRLHTIDLTRWKGDRGNDGFPEIAEAARALAEGRAARPVPWRRRITWAAIGSAMLAGVLFLSAVTGIVDAGLRWMNPGAFADGASGRFGADELAPETQEGFRAALAELARSSDLRTQRALTLLERSETRDEALAALSSLATDQGLAIEDQMRAAARLWRQIGLLRFNENPAAARAALEEARRFDPGDAATLTALGALYQREGRVAEADEVYRIVLSKGGLDASAEGRVRQVLGQAHLERGDSDGAAREFRRALALAQDSVDEPLEANLYIDFGLVELDRLNIAAARARFAEAAEFASLFDYTPTITYAKYNDAEALILAGQFDAAAAALREARAGAEAEDDIFLQLYIDLAGAKLAARRGESERALELLRALRSRARTEGLRLIELNTLLEIAENELRLGQPGEALSAAREARDGFQGIRATNAAELASLIEAAALTLAPETRGEACARVNGADAAIGSEYLRREMGRIARLARCSV